MVAPAIMHLENEKKRFEGLSAMSESPQPLLLLLVKLANESYYHQGHILVDIVLNPYIIARENYIKGLLIQRE